MNQEVEIKTYKIRILIGLTITFVVMAIVYIPLAFKAKFGVIDQFKDWDIESTLTDTKVIYGSALEKKAPYIIGNTIYFSVILKQPGDSIEYSFDVVNKGTLDARLEHILVNVGNEKNEQNAIKYKVSGIQQNDIIKAGEKKAIRVRVEWDPLIQEPIDSAYSTLSVSLNFVQN